jgi:hypothetical protein
MLFFGPLIMKFLSDAIKCDAIKWFVRTNNNQTLANRNTTSCKSVWNFLEQSACGCIFPTAILKIVHVYMGKFQGILDHTLILDNRVTALCAADIMPECLLIGTSAGTVERFGPLGRTWSLKAYGRAVIFLDIVPQGFFAESYEDIWTPRVSRKTWRVHGDDYPTLISDEIQDGIEPFHHYRKLLETLPGSDVSNIICKTGERAYPTFRMFNERPVCSQLFIWNETGEMLGSLRIPPCFRGLGLVCPDFVVLAAGKEVQFYI